MFSLSKPQEMAAVSEGITLKDLLCDHCGMSEYLSVSVTHRDGDTRLSLTTTHSVPVTYSTVIPAVSNFDLHSLVFVMES